MYTRSKEKIPAKYRNVPLALEGPSLFHYHTQGLSQRVKALPIGISFFTLQAITYVVDVYRGQVGAQKNPLYLGMYIAMFPQLVAGPIVRYSDIEAEIDNRRATLAGFAQGLRLFCVGLGKKVLLANTAGTLADSLLPREAAEIGFVGCFSGVAAYTFQIYFDFSGYSDMAIGLGKMMGFEYPRNFNYPYTSKSATEFWRRWHMSLGGFFRDYVYIPLGGNRVSTPRFVLNTMIVWGLTGIWHGAAWNFVLWGLYWGVLILAEKFFIMKALDRLPGFVSHIWCAVLFFFGWLLFAVERGRVVLRHVRRLRLHGNEHPVGAAVVELREPRPHFHRGLAALGAVPAQEAPGLGRGRSAPQGRARGRAGALCHVGSLKLLQPVRLLPVLGGRYENSQHHPLVGLLPVLVRANGALGRSNPSAPRIAE